MDVWPPSLLPGRVRALLLGKGPFLKGEKGEAVRGRGGGGVMEKTIK